MTHLTEQDLVLHYYGELPHAEEQNASTHLSDCAGCRREFTRLQRVLGAIDESVLAPELPDGFERTVWARLEPNLRPRRFARWLDLRFISAKRTLGGRESGRERRGWLSGTVLSPATLALTAAVLVLVGAAFFAGRLSSPVSNPPITAGTAAEHVRERILLIDLSEHLDRSQMVLVELASADAGESLDITDGRARAEQLLAANRLYRQTVASAGDGDTALGNLLDELEWFLVELSAGPERLSSQQVEEVRKQIEAKGLLFRVRVVSSEVRERQKEAIQRRAGQRSSSGV